MDPQNQNIKPDYDFILNKSGPPEAKPRSSKKWLIALVLAVIFFGGIGLFAALAGSGVEEQPDPSTTAVQRYLGLLSANQYDQAFSLYTGEQQAIDSQEDFVDLIGPGISSFLKISECQISKLDASTVQAICPNTENGTTTQVFSLTGTQPLKIEKIVWTNA